jgi:glycosyltransferase involved in cell wall biosynthesis
VCLVSANAYPLFNNDSDASFGGAELQLYLVARYLARDSRYSVSVIVGDFGQEEVESYDQVQLIKAHSRSLGILGKLVAPFRLFRAIFKARPDVLLQRASGPETGICALYARLKGIKFIYSVAHDAELAGESVASRHPLYNMLYKLGFSRADKIVVQSRQQLEALRKITANKYRDAVVIRNSIELPNLVHRKRSHVLWISRAQEWKRPELFLALAQEFPEQAFVMVMPGAQESKEFSPIVEAALQAGNVRYYPRVEFNESQELFNHALVFVNTSSWEGFPNTFLQAGVSSTPIVSLVVDPDSFIEENACGYACHDDFGLLVERIRFLLGDVRQRDEMGGNCHAYIERQHDINQNIEAWKQLLQ